jgi:ATP-dependent Clp protease ATP-binding subunit ClpB
VQDPLAESLLAGDINDGEKIAIGASDGALTIDGKPVGKPAVPPEATPTLLN